MKHILVLTFIVLAFSKIGFAQDPSNSIYSVSDQDKMYRMTIWRRVYMQEKINQSFFARNREISRILIDAVRDGLLIPFHSDSLDRRMTKEEFEERMVIKTGDDEDSWGSGNDWGDQPADEAEGGSDPWAQDSGDDVWGTSSVTTQTSFARDPTEINILEIKEEAFFDKIRSRMYYHIQSLTIYYTDMNTGIREPVASFDYAEAEKVFRRNPDRALWYNPQNPGQSRNLADAFLLRLFYGRIIKVSNPNDWTIREQVNDPQLALYLSQQMEYQLAEYESDLWEY
jgi:gliding motility associated protien GldN